jgi:hypothetical protein
MFAPSQALAKCDTSTNAPFTALLHRSDSELDAAVAELVLHSQGSEALCRFGGASGLAPAASSGNERRLARRPA